MSPEMCCHPEPQLFEIRDGKLVWVPSPLPPAVMMTCECGANRQCPTCGFGHGSIPCRCNGQLMAPAQPHLESEFADYQAKYTV